MRCKCCNAEETKRYKDDYYCSECFESIRICFKEMKERDHDAGLWRRPYKDEA